jgi:hypothetical protein
VATLVGLVPALQTSGQRLVHAMRGIAAQEAAGRRHSLRSGIVVAEVALAVLLLAGASLLLRSFGSLLRTDPGFNPDRVVALQVFAWDRNTTPERRAAFFQEILRRMKDDPLVSEVGAVSAMPFIEANIKHRDTRRRRSPADTWQHRGHGRLSDIRDARILPHAWRHRTWGTRVRRDRQDGLAPRDRDQRGTGKDDVRR